MAGVLELARPVSLLALIVLVGCQPNGKKPGDDTATDPETLRVEAVPITSNNRGLFNLEFAVQEGERFQVVLADPKKGILGTETLSDPTGNTALDGEDWYTSSQSLTSAVYGAQFASALNWPVREQDGPVAAGIWTLSGFTLDRNYSYAGNTDIDVTILYRTDESPAVGSVHAVVAYCTGVKEQEGVVEAMEAGVAYWQELYAMRGIELTVEYSDIAVDPDLPDTYQGVTEYQDLLAQKVDYPLLMVIGDQIAGDSYVYGEAGAIPGPMVASPISAVEISWLAHAGGNGKFSDNELAILGETMAHETGHYIGLFHPVEDGWEYWDALEDTPDCTSMSSCQDELGANLMFPYPVCTSMTECNRQDQLSGGQVGIMQRYVGVE